MSRSDDEDMEEALSGDEADASGEEEDEDGSSDEEVNEDELELDEVELEPRILPGRAARVQLGQAGQADEESADEDFWNQDFFAEDQKDEDFTDSQTESETYEDHVPDSDFSVSESESEGEAADDGEENVRKKTLKPPGAQRKRPSQASRPPRPPSAKDGRAPLSPRSRQALEVAQRAEMAEAAPPTLRNSTRQRSETARAERERAEHERPKKRFTKAEVPMLTQEQLLAEAAQTELENLASLAALQAREEELRKRAAVKRAKYTGPVIRYHSKKVDDVGLTVLEVVNQLTPVELKPQRAPPQPRPQICYVTGRPARYRDPVTKLPYADLAAFRVLRERHNAGRGVI